MTSGGAGNAGSPTPPRRWRRVLRRIAIGLCVLIVGCVIVGRGCADRFILHPTTEPIDAGRARRLRLTMPDGAKTLEVWTARSVADGEPDAYVLEFTGNATRAEQVAAYVADRWAPRKVEAWTVNHPGFGGSTGPARMRAIAPAALFAFDQLAVHAGAKPIFVCGNSIGCTAAIYVASQRPVAGVIIQNPPALRQVVMNQGWWNLWLLAIPVASQIPDELDAPKHAAMVHAPAIIITADADNLVMPKFQKLTIDAYAGPIKRLNLHQKGHNDSITTEAEWAEFRSDLDWLWNSAIK